MTTEKQEVMEYVDLLRNHSVTNISSIQKGMVPEVLDITWEVSNFYVYKSNRVYVTYEMEGYVLRVNGLRFKTTKTTRNSMIYDKRMTDAVKENLINPFMLFVDGRFVKWSTFRIVRNAKYTYIVCDNNSVEDINPLHISKVEIVSFPFNVSYSESRQIPKGNTEIFRFSEEGTLLDYGTIVFSVSVDTLLYKKYTALEGGTILNHDMDVDKTYKITKDNFICFKNKLFDSTFDPEVKNLNIITVDNGEPLAYDIDIRFFYRMVTNTNRSNITIPPNTGLLKASIIEEENPLPQLDITALQRDFDYFYKWDTDYEDNYLSGIRYLSRYNISAFDELYIKRSHIESSVYTGAGIKEKIVNNVFTMPRGNHNDPETYVMIHCEGELWKYYNRIRYNTNNFEIPLTAEEIEGIDDNNTFEIVYFSGVNNHFLTVDVTADNNTIENTTIKYDDLMVMTNYIEDHIYDEVNFNKRSVFPTDYKVDEKTKTISFTNTNLYGKTVYMAAKTQFKYAYFPVQHPSVRFYLTPDFVPSLDSTRYMVFVNGRSLSTDMFRVMIESNDNSVVQPVVHIRKLVDSGDRVEIFYLPYDINYVSMGKNNKVDVVSVRATTDRQPIFNIPFPSKSFLTDKNSFFVMRGSLIVDHTRYNVVGNKLIFNDPDDYLDTGRELTFIFLYNQNIDVNPYGFVKEEDAINLDARYTFATKKNQKLFEIPYPYEDYKGFFFITYRGLYVNPSRYTINESLGTINFLETDTGLDPGTAVIFTFCYPSQTRKVSATAARVKATIDNQTVFNIPLPYGDYFKDGNSFFLIRNGVYLSDNEYSTDNKANTVTLLTTDGLYVGQELVFNFFVGAQQTVKTAMIPVRAEKDKQLVFKLPEVFHDFTEKTMKFFIILGDTIVDMRRYEIVGNDLRFLSEEDAVPEGRELSFLFLYCEDIDASTATIGNIVNTSKYAEFESISVETKVDGQRIYEIPWKDSQIMDKKFFITIGSTFIDESRYDVSKSMNTITFNDDSIITSTDRDVTFTLVDSDYVVIEKEMKYSEAVVDNQMDFDIPLPYENYFKQGNKVLVFANSTFIDPSRYSIDTNLNKLIFIEYDDALLKGQRIGFLFYYIANSSNRSYEREDIQHTRIPEYGYIFLDRANLKHRMNPKLYFLYVNGKKINTENILDVSTNIIRIKNDIQTRFNTVIMDYTPTIKELEPYKSINSDFDIIMNKLSADDLDRMYNIYSRITDIEERLIPNVSQEAIINDIIRTHYLGTGVNKGLPFAYTYDTATLKNRDIYDLANTTHRYIKPGKYTLAIPAGINRINIYSIPSAARIKPIESSDLTLKNISKNKIFHGETSYILPAAVASFVDNIKDDLSIFCIPLRDVDRDKNTQVTTSPFVPGIVPKRITDTYDTLGDSLSDFRKLIIRNVKVYPGLTYTISVPENGWVNIAYNKWDTDYNSYHLPYSIDFDNDKDNSFIAYSGDTTEVANDLIGIKEQLWNISLDNSIEYTKAGDYTFTVPEGVNEIMLSMQSGWLKDPYEENITPLMARFVFSGYKKVEFAYPTTPKIPQVKTVNVNAFYDVSIGTYNDTYLNKHINGVELHPSSDRKLYGNSISEVGFLSRYDGYTIHSSGSDEYQVNLNKLLSNGVRISESIGGEAYTKATSMAVTQLEVYTVYVARGEESDQHGAISIMYEETVARTGDNVLYLSNVLNANDKNNAPIDYSYLNKELDGTELVDPNSYDNSSDDFYLENKNRPVYKGEKPVLNISEDTIESINKVIVHEDGVS